MNQIVHKSILRKVTSALLAFVFAATLCLQPFVALAQESTMLPPAGQAVALSETFVPLMIHGLKLHPENPLLFDFIIHPGQEKFSDDELQNEINQQVRYFLASLTVPANQMWVNLSPYEQNRIVPQTFGQTEMGRDLLAQDYILKQLTASLMNPDDETGSAFWQKVKSRAKAEFGTDDVPLNTFNKVWIVPQKAEVYVTQNSVFVIESRLKVMLEEDYLALEMNKNSDEHGLGDVTQSELKPVSAVSSQVIREIIIPELEREVNEGKTFAQLRQIYNALILANWYKENLKQSLLGQVYVDQNKIVGLGTRDSAPDASHEQQATSDIAQIYDQYLKAFEQGVYNFIKEEYDPATQQIIPRKYFSGGVNVTEIPTQVAASTAARGRLSGFFGRLSTLASFLVVSLGMTLSPVDADVQIDAPKTLGNAAAERVFDGDIANYSDLVVDHAAFASVGSFELTPDSIQGNRPDLTIPRSYADRWRAKWNPTGYQSPDQPVRVGVITETDRPSFSQPGLAIVKHMPIKLGSSNEFVVPSEFAQLEPGLQRIIDHASANIPDIYRYYAYLTTMQGEVAVGKAQNGSARVHADGVQLVPEGDRFAPNFIYAVGDSGEIPTLFFNMPFSSVARTLSAPDYESQQPIDITLPMTYEVTAKFIPELEGRFDELLKELGEKKMRIFNQIIARYMSNPDIDQLEIEAENFKLRLDKEESEAVDFAIGILRQYADPQVVREIVSKADPYAIYLLNTYVPHSGSVAALNSAPVKRTFFRVMFSRMPFPPQRNDFTANPHLPAYTRHQANYQKIFAAVKAESDESMFGGIDQSSNPVGGIDLNPAAINYESFGEMNIDFTISPQQIQNLNINGVTPSILQITPVESIPFLLGEVESPPKGRDVSYLSN